MLRLHSDKRSFPEPVVITGIGLIAANGSCREEVWESTRLGRTGIRRTDGEADGVPGLHLAAPVLLQGDCPSQLKTIRMARIAADEAVADAGIDFRDIDRDRFACAISGHVGDISWWGHDVPADLQRSLFNAEQWLPNSACWDLSQRFGLYGPRISHSTACASGLIDVLAAVRSIQDGSCDIALAGCSEMIDPLFAAGFRRMKVLADGSDPTAACMPFDARRKGFVMGEGAGMFVLERLQHALARNTKIYAEIVAGKMLADAHHVTSLNVESEALERLLNEALHAADVSASDIGYISAHGTGTIQNDLMEAIGIRRAFGRAADDLILSSLKSTLGHLIGASGSVELGVTVLGMRDGWAPPTLCLRQPDPRCDLDCVPLVGRTNRYQHAMKLALAFGGHLVATVIRRWNDADTGFAYPQGTPLRRAA